MFGGSGIGGALKNLGSKAENLFEKKKKEVEELAEQKKAAATELFQEQLRKTGELVSQSVGQAEKVVADTAEEAKHEAIDAFDAEVAKVEKAVDDGVSQANAAIDSKLKDVDELVDKKREEVVETINATSKQAVDQTNLASSELLGKAKNLLKSVFPPLNLHDHDQIRIFSSDRQDRQKKYLQNRGKSFELKESPEKEKTELAKCKGKSQQGCGTSSGNVCKSPGAAKSEQQKTPTKSEQKALLKLEQQIIKSELKAQQKLEKEQQKLEKEHQKEQLKLEKEQQKLEKEQLKLEKEQMKASSKNCFKTGDKAKANDYFNMSKDSPTLKSQRSIDVSCLKHQKSVEGTKPPARKSVDMQYAQNLLDTTSSASSYPSVSASDNQLLPIGSPTGKPKTKK